MKFLRGLLLVPMILALQAVCAHGAPSTMTITYNNPNPPGQTGLKRSKGESGSWTFSISTGSAKITCGPVWTYTGQTGGDPDWGTWTGGEKGDTSLTWSGPQKTGSFTITVKGKISCNKKPSVNFEATWSGEVVNKKWIIDTAIEGGELTQPANNDIENPQEIGPGGTVNLAVSEATDNDTWTQGADTGQEADTVHYKWTSSDGGFVTNENPDGDATEVKERTAQWKAPDEPGDYTITCTIDDEPAAVTAPDTGDRDDDPVTRTVHVKVQLYDITWEGLARSCAGGVGVDGAHDFTITGIAKRPDGSLVTGAELELSFDGNKGHIHRAEFVVDNGSGGNNLVEETTVTTDAQGKFNVHVLSSDDVSSDIKIKVKWTDENGKEHDVGEKACDFAASVSLRRFGLVNFPDEEDTGWIFDDTNLTPASDSTEIIAPSGTTPAKVYLKFQIDPSIPRDTNYFNSDGTPRRPLDDDGNWKFVNGHHVTIRIDKITPQEGETFDGTISDYATLLDASGQPADEVSLVTSSDGAAQVQVKAGPMISQAKEVVLSVEDTTEQSG